MSQFHIVKWPFTQSKCSFIFHTGLFLGILAHGYRWWIIRWEVVKHCGQVDQHNVHLRLL